MDNIRKACLLISRSNGGINRYRSEETVLREFRNFCEARPYEDMLKAIDSWLGTLTPEQFETVCDGEMSEADAILESAPAFTDTFLNDWFEVC
jgi:hypothetical protein